MHYLRTSTIIIIPPFSRRVFSMLSLLVAGFSDFIPFYQKADRSIIPFYYIEACCRRNGHNLGRQGLTSSFRGQNRIVLRSSPVFFQSSMAECIAFKWSEAGQSWRKSNELSGRIWASLPCREVRRSIGGTRLNPFSKLARNIEKLQPWKYGKYRHGKVTQFLISIMRQ